MYPYPYLLACFLTMIKFVANAGIVRYSLFLDSTSAVTVIEDTD